MTELKQPTPDEINRLWQHGLHEERLFHDRLNYFSFLETGLLTICVILYNKEPSLGLFLPLTGVALLFTFLWLTIQIRHWAYCVHVNERIRRIVPEYKETTVGFSAGGHRDGLSISKPLALGVPVLFACTWAAFIIWLILRPASVGVPDGVISVERIVLIALAIAVAWLVGKVRSLERTLNARAPQSNSNAG
jgi:hypothetical protein